MKSASLRFEHILYGLIFLAALLVRLLFLGSAPLSDSEASLALQAAAGGKAGLIEFANPAYHVLTSLFFDIFSPNNFLARFWPALAGSILVLSPIFFRRWLGPRAALILAAGLAVDPGLASLSRTAGSSLPALAAVILAAGAWLNGYAVAAGIFSGLALLTGPGLWPGVVGLAAAVLLTRDRLADAGHEIEVEGLAIPPINLQDNQHPRLIRVDWMKAGVAAAVTFAAVGTGLLTEPGGAGAAINSLPVYLKTWLTGGGMPLVSFLAALPFYEILPLSLGLFGSVRSLFRKSNLDRFLGLWLVLAAALAILNPARQPADLAWVLIPLWALAAREIDLHLALPAEERLPAIVQFGVAILVLVFVTISFTNLLDTFQNNPTDAFARSRQNLQWVVLLGAVLLLVLTSYLIAWGWAAPATLRGLIWAVVLVMSAFTITGATRSTGIDGHDHPELWQGARRVLQVDLLTGTMDDLSRWNTGFPAKLETAVIQVDSPAVHWALRNANQTQFLPALTRDNNPALIITPTEGKPGLPAAYHGQDFILTSETPWQDFALLDWMKWAVFRRAPQTPVSVILWARSDLFPDGKPGLTPVQTP